MGQEGIMRRFDSGLDISDEGMGKKQAEKEKAKQWGTFQRKGIETKKV